MTRKFKTLGVALFAALALTAVSASAASAANYTASAYPTTGTGESPVGNGTVITEAGNVECATHMGATLNAESSQLTAQVVVNSCKAFGFLSASVHMNGCDYLFTAPTGGPHAYTANVDIVCPAGKVITITAATCHISIPAQTNLANVTITDNTAAGDVSVQANIAGVGYTVVTDGFGCPFAGTGPKTGARMTHHAPLTFDSTNGATIDVG